MTGHDYRVERIEPVRIDGPDGLADSDLMSPYVWRQPDGQFGVLIRVVPPEDGDDATTGRIWYAQGEDGLTFTADDEPVIQPDPDGPDRLGCEDPTVVSLPDELIVYYTGVERPEHNRLLWARGPDVHALVKQGVALGHLPHEHDIKEAEVAVRDGHWTLGYEYADGDTSSIGVVEGEGPSGPWTEMKHRFTARENGWDDWHLSPGPLLKDDPDFPVMLYNGATKEAVWAIGWVVFDMKGNRVAARCEQPLIEPPGEDRGRNMAFAASVIEDGDRVYLYFTQNDRTLHRATIRRG